MAMARFSVLVLVLCACAANAAGTSAPVIGVLTVPFDGAHCETIFEGMGGEFRRATRAQAPGQDLSACFEVFYAQWLFAAGVQVAAIPYDAPPQQLQALLASVNGVLFTGGGLSLLDNTTYFQTAQAIFDYTVKANGNGDYFPLWGTCMGFQLLHILAAESQAVLEHHAFDSEDLSLPLTPMPMAAGSRFLGSAPADVWATLTTTNSTSNLHHDGINPDAYTSGQFPKLSAFFDPLSTSVDRKGKPFVSTAEAKTLPVYGVQWHPERPQFEWLPDKGINHTSPVVKAMQWASFFLRTELSKSNHAFPSYDAEKAALIYGRTVVHPTADSYGFYIFPPTPAA